jgi:hypothetical protein
MSTPEDVRNGRDVLSMPGILALTDIHPPETCYLRALCIVFLSQFAFEDTKISMDKRIRWLAELKVIKVPPPAGKRPA